MIGTQPSQPVGSHHPTGHTVVQDLPLENLLGPTVSLGVLPHCLSLCECACAFPGVSGQAHNHCRTLLTGVQVCEHCPETNVHAPCSETVWRPCVFHFRAPLWWDPVVKIGTRQLSTSMCTLKHATKAARYYNVHTWVAG